MQYGKHVTVLKEGILISSEQLELIGGVNSDCWGMWMHPWRSTPEPPHLIVSPFHPETWPALFRIRLRLDHKPGTTYRLAELLKQQEFNILSQNSAQTGHHHVTHNLIGTKRGVFGKALRESYSRVSEGGRDFENGTLRKWASTVLASRMLGTAQGIEQGLIRAHSEGRFLREQTFVTPNAPAGGSHGLVYDPPYLSREFQDLGVAKAIKSVHCDWLQYPAFFWLYGRPEEHIRFVHDRSLLRPTERDRRYSDTIDELSLPVPARALVSIDTRAQYLRLVISDSDASGQIALSVHYETNPSGGGNRDSIGGLAAVSSVLRKDYNIRGLWNSHLSFDWRPGDESGKESGRIHIVAEPSESGVEVDDDRIQRLRTMLEAADRPSHIRFERVEVSRVGAKSVFVSTKVAWWRGRRQGFQDRLRKRLQELGLEMIHASEEFRITGLSKSITSQAHQELGKASAFLQILPQFHGWAEGQGLQWLMFELGIAIERRLPVLIYVEVRQGMEEEDKEHWRRALKIARDFEHGIFDGSADGSAIIEAMDGGLRKLAAKL